MTTSEVFFLILMSEIAITKFCDDCKHTHLGQSLFCFRLRNWKLDISKNLDDKQTSQKTQIHANTLPKQPRGHHILHRGLKLNSKNSAREYRKKLNLSGPGDFPPGSQAKLSRRLPRSFPLPIMFKKYRDSMKPVITLTKIQSAREASDDLTLMDNS